MIPVFQTIYDPPYGNCFAACVASIIEVNISDVPNFVSEDWAQEWKDWLKPFNLSLDAFLRPQYDHLFPDTYIIAGVKSPRGDWMHGVIFWKNEFIFDPNVNYNVQWGSEQVVDYYQIYVRDIALPMIKPPMEDRYKMAHYLTT